MGLQPTSNSAITLTYLFLLDTMPSPPGNLVQVLHQEGKGAGTALSYLNVFRLNGSLCKASPPPGLLLPRKEPSWSQVPGPR